LPTRALFYPLLFLPVPTNEIVELPYVLDSNELDLSL